jgi:hypothetical protein
LGSDDQIKDHVLNNFFLEILPEDDREAAKDVIMIGPFMPDDNTEPMLEWLDWTWGER